MQTHNLIQGSAEWHDYRANHFNASDAPAMLGCSPYKTRSQLLHEMATGSSQDVDVATQRRFDDGHRYEALARPLAEEIIGEDLYPVVGSDGKYSASFDGLTMSEATGFEHKSLNQELREVMEDGDCGPSLSLHYRVQMEQQCMVSGCQRILFMASKWDGDQLVEERHCWYYPDAALRSEIAAGWKQFAEDLAAYVPPAVVVETVGRTPETLPALRIEVTGMVTASNLKQFKEHALAVFGGINRDLQTDQDFADAEKTGKWCGDVEDRLAAAKQHALSQTESIDALFRAIDEISAEARATRLELEKLVKARKDQVRAEILQEGVTALRQHIDALNTRLGEPFMPTVPADFAGAMKGKKTVSSLRDGVATTLANAKIEANATADRIQANMQALIAAGDKAHFPDAATLVLKAPDDLRAIIAQRVAETERRIEEQRERIAAEERAKAEAKAKAEMEATVTRTQAMMETHQQSRSEQAAPTLSTVLHAAAPRAIAQIIAPPSLRLGQIGERLGFTVTADFLTSLGFPPATTEKSAKLYRDADFPAICAAIAQHVTKAAQQFKEAA